MKAKDPERMTPEEVATIAVDMVKMMLDMDEEDFQTAQVKLQECANGKQGLNTIVEVIIQAAERNRRAARA